MSNRPDGTLNYHLGDVAVSPGDNLVGGVDISALGAAYAAGLGAGFWSDLEELTQNWRAEKTWQPEMSRTVGPVPVGFARLASHWKMLW